jgi:hypothetical protein
MSSQELRDEAIKAFVEYGEAMKKAFNIQEGDLLAAPLINTIKSGDEETIKEFIADAKRQTARFKAMIDRLSS